MNPAVITESISVDSKGTKLRSPAEPAEESLNIRRKEQYVSNGLHLDVSSTLKWKIDNFALLTMRHSELRSPEFEGPKNTRWSYVLILGDPRQKKAEERFVESQLFLIHCPEDAVGYQFRAGYKFFTDEISFSATGAVDTEPANWATKADPHFVQHSWHYPNSMTTLFTDKCSINGGLRIAVTIEFNIPDHEIRLDRKLTFPINFPHFIPSMLFLNDLFFITAKDQRVPAHKAFMREVSKILKEAIDSMGSAANFSVKQFHSEAVSAFVVYCYTGVLHESFIRGFGVQVLKLGHVFNVPSVIFEAADYLLRNVEVEGAVRCFKIASEYGAHIQLKKAALQVIAKKYPELLNGPGGILELLNADQITQLGIQLSEVLSCNALI